MPFPVDVTHPSAARTATPPTAPRTYEQLSDGVQIVLTVTAASGTGGLKPQLFWQGDEFHSVPQLIWQAPQAVTTTGTFTYVLCSGNPQPATLHVPTSLPLTGTLSYGCSHLDGSSYTYQMSKQPVNKI